MGRHLIEAERVELGDTINGERVYGWFVNGMGRMVIEHGGRWHAYSPHAQVVTPAGWELSEQAVD